MRPHLAYQEFPQGVQDATVTLFESKPWRGEDNAEKHDKFEGWLKAAAQAYGVTAPTLAVVEGSAPDIVDRPGAPEIILDKYSVTNMFMVFRMWVNNSQGFEEQQHPFLWAVSLFYQFHPRAFRRAVRRGIMTGVRPIDLIHPRSEQALCIHCEDNLWKTQAGTWRHVETGKRACPPAWWHEPNAEYFAEPFSTALDDEDPNIPGDPDPGAPERTQMPGSVAGREREIRDLDLEADPDWPSRVADAEEAEAMRESERTETSDSVPSGQYQDPALLRTDPGYEPPLDAE